MRLLELLLPAGRASGALVLGSGCPQRLRPRESAGAALDLIVIAPTREELAAENWIEQAAATSAARLSADGLVYVLVAPGERHRARRLLHASGLTAHESVLHLPDLARSRHLVPISRAPARHAFTSVVPLRPSKRAAAGVLLNLGGADLLASRARPVATLSRRPDARPLLDWLSELTGRQSVAGQNAVMSSSWRPDGPRVVLQPFPQAGRPLVAKLACDGGHGADTEGSRLTRLGPGARSAGAAVPEPVAISRLRGCDLLVETRLDGTPLAPLLVRRPARLAKALAAVCAWLEQWALRTAVATALSRAQLEREVLRPAQALTPLLEGGSEYLAYLRACCSAAEGITVPMTASHNDLTMWNVLVGGRAPVGVVDWEAAEDHGLPLRDFPYAVVDAVAATTGYADRPGAVRASFEASGSHADAVAALLARQQRALGVSAQVVELSFHACWLGHAMNERRTASAADPLPFREIVQWLARRLRR